MKKGISLLFFIVFTAMVMAQSADNATDPDQLQVPVQAESEEVESAKVKKFDTDFTLGSSFIYSPGNFYGPSMYAEPSLGYRLSPRLTLRAGAGFELGRFHSLSNTNEGAGELLPMTRMYLFTSGSYQLTDRLILGGTAIKGVSNYPGMTANAAAFQYNYEALGVDLQYKITPSFSIGVGLRIQNGSYYPQDELIPAAGYVPWGGF